MNEQPTHLDLFSGIGGFALAAEWAGFKTVGFCEIDAYCQAIIKERFGAVSADSESQRRPGGGIRGGKEKDCKVEHMPADNVRPVIYGGIRTLDGRLYAGVNLLTGGFPCQPFSVAGKRRGKEDDRFLWPEMLRVIAEARPTWVLGENVAGIVQMELDRCLSDLEAIGYACWPLVIPACAVDAKHRRDRVWIMGHADEGRIRRAGTPRHSGYASQPSEAVANGDNAGLEGRRRAQLSKCASAGITRAPDSFPNPNGEPQRRIAEPRQECCLWEPEPNVGRVANGLPARVDRLKGLGNAVVPQVAFEIIKVIKSLI